MRDRNDPAAVIMAREWAAGAIAPYVRIREGSS